MTSIHHPPSTIIPILFNDIFLFSISTATHINYNKFESLMKWVMGLKATNKSESWSFISISQQYNTIRYTNQHKLQHHHYIATEYLPMIWLPQNENKINGNQHENENCWILFFFFLEWKQKTNRSLYQCIRQPSIRLTCALMSEEKKKKKKRNV